MGLIETDETNKFTFEPFAAHQFYTDVNRNLVQQALAQLVARAGATTFTIVDMACGTGAITRLIAEEMVQRGYGDQTRLIGVDPSAEALRRAQKGMEEMGLNVQAEFIQGDAEDLVHIVKDADAAFFCNAIHLVADKLAAMKQVAAILVSGGIFACNSAFYEGTYVPGTERFYRLWTRRAVGLLKKEHPEVQLSREAKAMAMQWLTPAGYINHFKESGFGQVHTHVTSVSMSLDAWRDLGQYWLFIEGALPGVPLAYGAKALGVAVYQAGQELNLEAVSRNWLQIVATKS
ncbi:MAG: methyltransferase domain-containing protein [Chloroflexi bacterium]|nr:MAG: methyltransferase domain-containing protein [Chloroflexota bacterium]